MLQDPNTGDPIDTGTVNAIHAPAAATQATTTKTAAGAGVRNICRSIAAYIACGATPQTPIGVVLRDGATGVGTILWEAKLAAPANGYASVEIHDLFFIGSDNTAMTLEFLVAGVAASEQAVNMGTVESIL